MIGYSERLQVKVLVRKVRNKAAGTIGAPFLHKAGTCDGLLSAAANASAVRLFHLCVHRQRCNV